jgi:hypothetical protein
MPSVEMAAPNYKKVQAAADAFGYHARTDEEAAQMLREWLGLFVEAVEEDGKTVVVYREDAEEQVVEWAAECVMELPVEQVRSEMPAEEVRLTLNTIHFSATRLWCDTTHKLSAEELQSVLDKCNTLKGARPMGPLGPQSSAAAAGGGGGTEELEEAEEAKPQTSL